jgi:hypothetical protein
MVIPGVNGDPWNRCGVVVRLGLELWMLEWETNKAFQSTSAFITTNGYNENFCSLSSAMSKGIKDDQRMLRSKSMAIRSQSEAPTLQGKKHESFSHASRLSPLGSFGEHMKPFTNISQARSFINNDTFSDHSCADTPFYDYSLRITECEKYHCPKTQNL